MKKFISCLLAASMLLTASSSLVMAKEINKTDSRIDLKESIIRDYQDSIVDLKFNSNATRATSVKDNVSKIQADTVKSLNDAGYYAYDVNPDTFETVEDSLKTDLEAAGLNPEYSYIILVEGENDDLASRSAVSPSFSHTYNGNTYTLRWFTVYASDYPLMGKASDVNVLSSTSQTIIQNCLDAAISTYISSVGNIYEAVYQMYLAIDEGRPYNGIDTYEAAIGKKILKVIADKDDEEVFYSMNLPNFKKQNCFNDTLYFVCDDGILIVTQYADFWVDSELTIDNGVDVSVHFPGIVGETIKQFKFDHRSVVKGKTHYGQPITTIEMESGDSVRFSINFGDVKNDERAAYFEIKNAMPFK